jgi:PHD/YefM family antitoxin component YafN of YafNO toxin-antitoxin module
MKTIDLRRQEVSLDELLRSVGADSVRITSKNGEEFVLEAADAFEHEAAELGRSAKFMAFLAERSAEPGRISLADIESRLARPETVNPSEDATAEAE